MIERVEGDILKADAEALVNTVNCVGVMGRGIALQFKKAFAENYRAYRAVCDEKQLHLGMVLVHDLRSLTNPLYIINFPTKRHWKGKSRIEDIDAGLKALVTEVRQRDIRSIAVPPLGAGLGGLDWRDVRPRIEAAFRDLPEVRVLVFEPVGPPAPERMARPVKVPTMTIGRAALVGLMQRYLAAVMDPFVSLLEIHKLMYFMQAAGEPLKLKFSKAIYGPYAVNLRHVLTAIEAHFITGYGDAEDQPEKPIELLPGIAEAADSFLQDYPNTRDRFGRVVDLIEGFETSFGMELLSTVHWVAANEGASTLGDAVSKVYAWNSRKRMFGEAHVHVAWDVLRHKGWVAADAV